MKVNGKVVVVTAALVSFLMVLHKTRYGSWDKCVGLSNIRSSAIQKLKFINNGYLVFTDASSSIARYGRRASRRARPFRAIVIHSTLNTDIDKLVRYSHSRDRARKGSFGYHFYIDINGDITQAAPLHKRTNHVLPAGNKHRKKNQWGWVTNSNSIGIGVVGALRQHSEKHFIKGKLRPVTIVSEKVKFKQLDAAMALVTLLSVKFKIKSINVVGHGELQNTRYVVEGHHASAFRRNPDLCD